MSKLYKRVRHTTGQLLGWGHQYVCRAITKDRVQRPKKPKPHGLPGELIISLTSYAPRFKTLHPTLVYLLSQTMHADRIILWVSEQDYDLLPQNVLSLTTQGLEIRTAENFFSYKKIIPALKTFPNAFIVTADDDIFYDRNWLKDLVEAWDGSMSQIVTHRAHRIVMCDNGAPDSYTKWEYCISGPCEAKDIFPTGAGGVFYPPGILPAETVNQDEFMEVCPRADDVWLYWMGRKAGAVYKKTPSRRDITEIFGSQTVGLWMYNLEGNDGAITAMIGRYGWPQG